MREIKWGVSFRVYIARYLDSSHYFYIFRCFLTRLKMNSVFVSLEGFQLGKVLIAKELHILDAQTDEFKHFVFMAPDVNLTHQDKLTIRYSTLHLHQLSWNEGDIPYCLIGKIFKKIRSCVVYCYGYTTTNFLRSMMPTTVIIDIQDIGYTMPKTIPAKVCFRDHTPRHCAAAKAHAIRDFVRTNKTQSFED